MTETQEQRRERLSGRMDERGAEWALKFLGIGVAPDGAVDPRYAEWFTEQPRGRALRHLAALDDMHEHKRERHLVSLMGLDGTPT